MTDLVIAGVDVPPYAQRGVEQSYRHVPQAAQFRRTWNGKLVNLATGDFEKIESTITFRDQQDPGIVNDVWPGKVVTVDCLFWLHHPTVGGSPRYGVVESYEEDGRTFYRPRIVMMVTSYDASWDEWGANHTSTIVLEEVG